MEEYQCCPSCGENETKKGVIRLAVRKCRTCGRLQCSECGKEEERTGYKCKFCRSNDLGPVGFIKNRNYL